MKTITMDQFGSTRKALSGLAVALLLSWIPVSAHAATVGYWRFESGNLLTDSSGNGLNLTAYTGGSGGAISYTLPTTGAGSAFPTVIPQTGVANGTAAQGSGVGNQSWGSNTLHTADQAVLSLTSGITIETFVNLSSSVNGVTRAIAAQGGNAANGSWTLALAAKDSPRGANDLIFQWQSTAGNWGSGGFTTLDSGIKLTTGNDYYIAFAMDLANTATGGAVFYVQDLTAGTPMQIISLSHTATAMYDSSLDLTIGSTDLGLTNFAGTIDEMRLSNVQLTASQLLMVPEPKAWALCLLAAAMLVIARRRRAVLNI